MNRKKYWLSNILKTFPRWLDQIVCLGDNVCEIIVHVVSDFSFELLRKRNYILGNLCVLMRKN